MPDSRKHYMAEVGKWSMDMLDVLKVKPNTADKLTLLQQVDKVKMDQSLSEERLPAYAAALAFLSVKAARLLKEEELFHDISREEVATLLKSRLLRRRFSESKDQFIHLKDFISLKNRQPISPTIS